ERLRQAGRELTFRALPPRQQVERLPHRQQATALGERFGPLLARQVSARAEVVEDDGFEGKDDGVVAVDGDSGDPALDLDVDDDRHRVPRTAGSRPLRVDREAGLDLVYDLGRCEG